jgi:ABC-type bacteriocin/lantibiotic exporter with double-glycine peptidase domain
VVAVLLLHASTPLGLLVLVGVPLLVGTLSLILRPLQRRQALQREEAGRLTTLGADTVAGLRVLRGIGGEQTFLRRYEQQSQRVRVVGTRVAGIQATLDAAQVLLPGIFVVLVTWLGARFAVDGKITPGELVAFYGYSAFLVIPLRTATEFADRATRAYIGARKIIRVLQVEPDTIDGATTAAEPPAGRPLTDPVSEVTVAPGRMTAVVSGRPQDSAALADRLGRFGPLRTPVTLDGVPLADLPLPVVRRRVVVSENDPRLFTGTLREELDPTGRHDDEAILAMLTVASGEDILDALPAGLDSEVEERGRSFSGGQRQRLALVRALLTDAETLVLVEPTSAVDAHTESRIAGRLAQARRGRTTVVMSTSPLLLDHADDVLFLHDGRVAAAGTHHELMTTCRPYRDTVVRGEDPA